MDKYEYHTYLYNPNGLFGGKVDADQFNNAINQYGSQGWELVNCVASNQSYGATTHLICVFKRRVLPDVT